MVQIYGADWCGPCQQSKKWCEETGKDFEFFEYTDLIEVFTENGWKTIPQIFVDGEHIGGYDDLVKHDFK